MALVGLGFRSLSMAASSIGPARLMIRSLDAGRISGFIDSLLAGTGPSLRTVLSNYARDHDLRI
jgi:phosphotransferase system enzyme I (PtsP)